MICDTGNSLVAAHGGLEALRTIKDFTLKEKSKIYARYQSPAADGPFVAGTFEETLIVDTERGTSDLKLERMQLVFASP